LNGTAADFIEWHGEPNCVHYQRLCCGIATDPLVMTTVERRDVGPHDVLIDIR
jgi:hypothetical protein